MRLSLLTVAALAAAGCANNNPCDNVFGACIALTVDGSGSVDTLRLALSGAVQAERIAPTQQTLTTLPVYLALQLAHANGKAGAPFTGGDVRIDVEATRAGTLVGSASTHVTLSSSDHIKATVTLAAGPLPAGDNLSMPPADLAAVCSATDLAVLANDPLNCGSCGHDCLGGACAGGRCQPMVLALLQDTPIAIAVDANNVYFSRTSGAHQGIARQPFSGGAPIDIYTSSTTAIAGMAFSGGKLIVDESYLHLETLPAPAGAAALTPGYDTAATSFAIDATHIYYANNTDTMLRAIDIALGGVITPTDVGATPQHAVALASDGTTLYYANGNGIGGITLPTGTAQSLSSIGSVVGLAVDGSTLWATTTAGTILELTRSGNVLSVADTIVGLVGPTAITVDSSAVYFINQGDATVMRVAR